MKLVLAAVDFSDATPRVVEAAATLAEAMDAYVLLVHVARVPKAMPHYAREMDSIAALKRAIETAADRQLAALKEGLERRGICTQSLLLTGDPKIELSDQAGKLAADYVVMGSHAHAALHGLLLGSTTNAVIKRSHRIVVVVPAPIGAPDQPFGAAVATEETVRVQAKVLGEAKISS